MLLKMYDFSLEEKKKDKKAQVSAFVTNSLKDLKIITKFSKFQFPYL